MPRFILIDNSITDTTGHHFQYAMFCLSAAKSLGLEPVLVTNKKYVEYEKVAWDTFPIYHHGFWFSHDKPSGVYGFFNRLKSSLQKRNIIVRIRQRYSKLGFYMEISWMLEKFLTNKTIDNDGIKISKRTLLLIGIFLVIPAKIFLYLKNKSQKFFQLWVALKNYLFYFIKISKSEPVDIITGNKLLKSRINVFAKDTQDLFHKINLTDDDHVFIPTAGLTEILGILECFRNSSRILKTNWHFLFRRNIFQGTRIQYSIQQEQMRGLRNAFQTVLEGLANEKVFFYTDTNELTEQFAELKIAKFTTLPIPHTHPASSHKINEKKIIISYLGDARTEKGYHFLPDVVDDLWQKYVKTGEVIFKIQSNFNIPGGEPKSALARNMLSIFPSDKIALMTNGLSQKEYSDLLLGSNIILLPYDENNYYARSSGILAEALAAGIPVVVPARTWMSRQFQRKIYEYHLSLKNELKLVQKLDSNNIRWYSRDFKQLNFSHDKISFQDHDKRILCSSRVTKESTHCLISFDFSEDPLSSFVGVYVNQFDSKLNKLKSQEFLLEKIDSISKGTIFIKLQDNLEKLVIELKNPETTYPVTILNFEINFLKNEIKNNKVPLSVIGNIYKDPSDISQMLSELIENYSHYLKTAKEFSREYYEFHNARTLVNILLSDGKTAR